MKAELKRLMDQGNQRLEVFKNSSIQYARDAVDIYNWIQKNKDSFQGRVYGPLALEISVDGPVMAAMVEAQIPNYLLVCKLVFMRLSHVVPAMNPDRVLTKSRPSVSLVK